MKRLLILCGAPGSGKTRISNYLQQQYKFSRVITHTTRPTRPAEVAGQDYYFESELSFKKHHYFERVVYDQYHYGSSREGLEQAWNKSDNAVIVLDTKGALTYCQQLPEQTICCYITVSTPQILLQRVEHREVTGKKHLQSQEGQRDLQIPVELKDKCQVLINDEWQQTVKNLERVLKRNGLLSEV